MRIQIGLCQQKLCTADEVSFLNDWFILGLVKIKVILIVNFLKINDLSDAYVASRKLMKC